MIRFIAIPASDGASATWINPAQVVAILERGACLDVVTTAVDWEYNDEGELASGPYTITLIGARRAAFLAALELEEARP